MTFRRLIPIFGLFFLCSLIAYEESTQACEITGEASFSPSKLEFGEVTIGDQKSLTFRIQNIGDLGEVEIDSIQSLNSKFQVTSAPKLPFCLLNNDSIDIEVTFIPTSDLELVSQIRIKHSNGFGNPDVVSMVIVSGKGKSSAGLLSVNPSSLDFGEVSVGQSSQKSFSIKNNGSSSQSVKVQSNNSAFSITSPSFPKTINSGQSLDVTVKFQPNKVGNFSGKLSVIGGNGQTAAEVEVFGAGTGNPDINVSPSQLNYGQLDVGTFEDLSLTISNTGNGTLDIQSFKFSNQLLSISPKAPAFVDPGKSKVFKVRFTTATKGNQTATLTIQSNDPDDKTVQVSLVANGVGGKLGFTDHSVSSNLRGNPIHTKGLQWVDFDNDNKVDLYIAGTNGNVICKNIGQSKFSNPTAQARLGNSGQFAQGASWADVDNDGDLDVFIANENGPSVILKNNHGKFSPAPNPLNARLTPEDTTRAEGGIFLDFNRDGRLDLYIVRNGAPNQLLKNTGIFNFVNIAGSAKVDLNSSGRGAVVADFNADGLPDIYVVNFNRPNKLFVNNGNETFRDATASAGVGFSGGSQQAVVSDFDNDGDTDLFVVNANGASVLFRNQGNLKFQKATGAAGIAGPKSGRSAAFADYDNDGDDDLLLLQSGGGNIFFRNDRGHFTRVGNVDLSKSDDPTSVVDGDFNNDGLIDVVVGDGDQGNRNGDSIFLNSGGDGNNFLILTLQGTVSNRSAIGAKVLVKVGLIPQAREVSAGNGKNQESLPLEFGLGAATSAATVTVFWPSGITQTLNNVAAGRLKIVEPTQ